MPFSFGSLRQVCTAAVAANITAPETTPEAWENLSVTKTDSGVDITVEKSDNTYRVSIVLTDASLHDGLLHWGINDWEVPPEAVQPPGTREAGDQAVQTPISGNKITLSFPADGCPSKVVFVLKKGETWTNNGGSGYSAFLKPPGVDELHSKIMAAEGTYEHWSLFSRFNMALSILEAADAAGAEGMALVATWLRLSTMRQLDWYRKANYQGKDIAHVQKQLAQRMAEKARGAKDPWCRLFARMSLAGLPRGGGDGDAIRMGILNIMREHGIREGHRPGIECHFLEQWHQKLHQNTTPEDIHICEAYIAYLHTNNMDDFWRVLWDNGQVSREALSSMTHPITAQPLHLPQLIPSMKHYLWILKTTHSGADMDVALEMARGHLDGELAWIIGDILANRTAWWVPGKIVQARHRLKQYWQREGASRDVLLLDIALDSYFRLCVERTDLGSLSGDDLISLVILILDNASVAAESSDLEAALSLWRRVAEQERWSGDWARLAMAASDFSALCLQEYMDRIAGLVQPFANDFKAACNIEPKYTLNFGEEVVRGQPVFMLSVLLRALGPKLRGAASLGPWQVVSAAGAEGEVLLLPNLDGVQGQTMPGATIILTERLTGNEDIPEGVTAVLTSSATDVLSHIAIRARAQKVLLATCFDHGHFEGLKELAGSHAAAVVTPVGDVSLAAIDRGSVRPEAVPGSASKAPKISLAKPAMRKRGSSWVLQEPEFKASVVGGKSLNLAALRQKLDSLQDVSLPASLALPFGTFEAVLASPENAAVAKTVSLAVKELAGTAPGSGVPKALARLRELIPSALAAPAGFKDELAQKLVAESLVAEGTFTEQLWSRVWQAICTVWASKWTDRAWLSRRAQAIPDADLSMAVLLQPIVPADYAFVLHSADPLTGQRGSVHGEVVLGMGEALVGNSAGRALAFSAAAGAPGAGAEDAALLALPSKRLGLYPDPSQALLIARSDSNGEDLEAYAGAGLYESVPLAPLLPRTLDYAAEPLVWDAAFRADLLHRLTSLAAGVEAAFGGVPQDIEGVLSGDRLYVVQARPQVVQN
ncbi:GWD2 [Auxenochlorella protothecoides x Auxenochlorella symbiontica]